MTPGEIRALLDGVRDGSVAPAEPKRGCSASCAPSRSRTWASPRWTTTAPSARASPRSSSAWARRPAQIAAIAAPHRRPRRAAAGHARRRRGVRGRAAPRVPGVPVPRAGPRDHPAPRRRRAARGVVAIVSAGTSDLPVAEEAAVTAEIMGNDVERIYDVGVAGIHRVLAERDRLESARVIVVVAGMEGALPERRRRPGRRAGDRRADQRRLRRQLRRPRRAARDAQLVRHRRRRRQHRQRLRRRVHGRADQPRLGLAARG